MSSQRPDFLCLKVGNDPAKNVVGISVSQISAGGSGFIAQRLTQAGFVSFTENTAGGADRQNLTDLDARGGQQ
jgi:hypothetical protein